MRAAAMGCALMSLAVLSSPACHKTKLVGLDEALATTRAWVTLSDQSVVLVYGPKVYGNKLVGFVDGKYEEYPVAQVKEAHVREPDGVRTAALVAAGMVGLAGFAYVISGAASSSKGNDYCDAPEHVDEPVCATP
jgi:hypothetical protein